MFSHMKLNIEAAVKFNGMPSLMITHSLGSLVALYFFDWLKKFPDWQDWVAHHVLGYCDYATCQLRQVHRDWRPARWCTVRAHSRYVRRHYGHSHNARSGKGTLFMMDSHPRPVLLARPLARRRG